MNKPKAKPPYKRKFSHNSIPKGKNPYAKAKQAEQLKDLESAKHFYQQAINQNDRAESAVKDLSSILHRQHRTKEACEFLRQYQYIFSEPDKYRNLYSYFYKQLTSSGSRAYTMLKIFPVFPTDTPDSIRNLFDREERIEDVQIYGRYVILVFSSHSAARKTLDSFNQWGQYTIEWMSRDGSAIEEEPNELFLLGKTLYEEI